ncbi:WD40/YVTN/BNR-like repeat-containing protein [Micromonospora fulviviridis]|uniref:Sialidase family protein n=1 Tax=Micromonospora fulviviridis TaxID=47860 RepID=A0ABV2VRY5_9ACTN
MSDRELPGFDVAALSRVVRQPPLEELRSVARLRARARRRQRGGLLLAVVAALAGTALTPVAGGLGGVGQPTADPTGVPAPPAGAELFLLADRSVVAVRVTNINCELNFTNTRDFGRTWSPYRPARYDGPCRIENRRGRSNVEYFPLSARTYRVSVDGRSYLSTDEGRTWRDGASAVVTVDAFPPKAQPVSCGLGCRWLPEPMAVDPDTGTAYRLRAGVSTPYPMNSLYASPDGVLWAAFWPGDVHEPSVLGRSADRGATWETSPAPNGGAVMSLVAESGQVAYLLAEPYSPMGGVAPAGSIATIMRTGDGGRTWQRVGTDLPAGQAGDRDLVLGSDGSLLIGDTDPNGDAFVWVSRDQGRHFTKNLVAHKGGVISAPGQVLVMGADGVRLTTDGRTATRLPGLE